MPDLRRGVARRVLPQSRQTVRVDLTADLAPLAAVTYTFDC
jgi:hypothetical protein